MKAFDSCADALELSWASSLPLFLPISRVHKHLHNPEKWCRELVLLVFASLALSVCGDNPDNVMKPDMNEASLAIASHDETTYIAIRPSFKTPHKDKDKDKDKDKGKDKGKDKDKEKQQENEPREWIQQQHQQQQQQYPIDIDPQHFPNIERIGMGYDLIASNPLSISNIDPGYRSQVFDLVYTNNTSGDYLVPDGFEAHEYKSCTYEIDTKEIKGESSYSDLLSSSVHVGGQGGISSLLSGSFSASSDFKKFMKESRTSHWYMMSAVATCTQYDARIHFPPINADFTREITKLSKDPNNMQTLRYILTNRGTHIITQAYMGARAAIFTSFTDQTYHGMQQQGFNFEVAASASFKLFVGDVKHVSAGEREMAEEYELHHIRHRESYIGAEPSTDGDWTTWARDARKSPIPITYTLTPLSDLLLTPEFFPSIPPVALSLAQASLQAAILKWCVSGGFGTSCSGPAPDPNYIIELTSNSGADHVRFPCPEGLPLSVGFGARSSKGRYWSSNPGYWINWWGDQQWAGICWAPGEYIKCNVLCTTMFSQIQYRESGTAAGVTTVSCNPGFKVASCLYSGHAGYNIESFPYSYPVSDTTCECYNYFGAKCQVSCVPESEISGHQVVSNQGTAVDVVCPHGKRLLGCGYRPTGSKREDYWTVAPINQHTCHCYNYFGVTCYAICAIF